MAVCTTAVDGTEERELDFRALAEYMTVLDDVGRAKYAPDMYSVTTQSGAEYLVDVRLPACECPDHEYRGRVCKHIRRAQFATGRRDVPAWIDADAVDPALGEHVDDVDTSDESDQTETDSDDDTASAEVLDR